jgi:hypothetical protein
MKNRLNLDGFKYGITRFIYSEFEKSLCTYATVRRFGCQYRSYR